MPCPAGHFIVISAVTEEDALLIFEGFEDICEQVSAELQSSQIYLLLGLLKLLDSRLELVAPLNQNAYFLLRKRHGLIGL